MRVLVAGATGALGSQLVPLLLADGHQVTGTTTTPARLDRIRAAGADAAVLDILDRRAVAEVVGNARPDAVIHQATSLAAGLDLRKMERTFAVTNRLRSEGTDHLIAAAREVGATRFLAQSYAGWPFARTGGPVKTEDEPLDPDPPAKLRSTLAAIKHLESAVTGIGGTVLRYGGFYGPGTSLTPGGEQAVMLSKRQFPLVGNGNGVWSFIHIRDAAVATALALTGPPGIYHIVDDEPAPVREWLPFIARVAHAKPPLRLPAWLARLVVGEHAVVMMTAIRGAANAKARSELGWVPEFPSWRQGFPAALA